MLLENTTPPKPGSDREAPENGSPLRPTLVLGASLNPTRISHFALNMLQEAGHPVYALGGRAGQVGAVVVHADRTDLQLPPDLHTVTLYLSAARQAAYADLLLRLAPKRIIFNPGAEHPELFRRASAAGVTCLNACTLVLLSQGVY